MAFALSQAALAAGHRLFAFDEIGSTNAEALARARKGEGGPCWFVTDRQTAGRGRRGNAWETPRGNLAATFLLTVATPPAVTANLAFAAGLAVREALLAFAPASAPVLKWPNDVLVGGAKIAGILLETETAGQGRAALAIGIGVNVVAAPQGLPYRAIALSDLAAEASAGAVFAALSQTLPEAISAWDEGRGLPPMRERWLACAAGLGREITVRAGDNVSRGTFETLDADGRLVLRLAGGGRQTVGAGEVHLANELGA